MIILKIYLALQHSRKHRFNCFIERIRLEGSVSRHFCASFLQGPREYNANNIPPIPYMSLV